MPVPILVFVGNARCISRDNLFARSALRRAAGHVVARERLGEHAVYPIGPAAVMLDDFIGDLRHVCSCCCVAIFRLRSAPAALARPSWWAATRTPSDGYAWPAAAPCLVLWRT